MNMTNDLNKALGIWFSYYIEERKRNEVINVFGYEYGERLIHDIIIIKDQFWSYEPDWTKQSLEEAAEVAVHRIKQKYPDLNDDTLLKMRNSFSFSYR